MSDEKKKPDNLFNFVVGAPVPYPGVLPLPADIETVDLPSDGRIERPASFELEGPPLDAAAAQSLEEWATDKRGRRRNGRKSSTGKRS